jgi:quinol-cytochrome oxidoreductase complex cytochrome b subunit
LPEKQPEGPPQQERETTFPAFFFLFLFLFLLLLLLLGLAGENQKKKAEGIVGGSLLFFIYLFIYLFIYSVITGQQYQSCSSWRAGGSFRTPERAEL